MVKKYGTKLENNKKNGLHLMWYGNGQKKEEGVSMTVERLVSGYTINRMEVLIKF